jgi:hypothetical protein
MKLILPAQLSAPRFHKDGSVAISFETRELTAEEIQFILGCRNSEGWLLYSHQTSNFDDSDVPDVKPNLDLKSPSELLKDVIYVHYKQATESQQFVGLFDTFYREQMEKIRQGYKTKNLHD